MKTVNEIITENSFFNAMKTSYDALYGELFGNTSVNDLDMELLNKCGNRYCSPLLSHHDITDVITFIVIKYSENWKRIKETLRFDYDVLSPYKVTQETKVAKTATNSNTGESKQQNGIVGFDSDVATPSSVDTNTDTNTTNATESTTTTVTNTGNNGNTNYADLITKEIEVRKNSFIDLVLNDIQSQITLDIY